MDKDGQRRTQLNMDKNDVQRLMEKEEQRH